MDPNGTYNTAIHADQHDPQEYVQEKVVGVLVQVNFYQAVREDEKTHEKGDPRGTTASRTLPGKGPEQGPDAGEGQAKHDARTEPCTRHIEKEEIFFRFKECNTPNDGFNA